jgi:hypothetical protein
MTSWLTKGLPRQFWLMKENKRCAISLRFWHSGHPPRTRYISTGGTLNATQPDLILAAIRKARRRRRLPKWLQDLPTACSAVVLQRLVLVH